MDSINEELNSEGDFASATHETNNIILYPFAHQVRINTTFEHSRLQSTVIGLQTDPESYPNSVANYLLLICIYNTNRSEAIRSC